MVGSGTEGLEAWILPGAHLIRFKLGNFAACELVTDQETGLPTEGAVSMFPCNGEHEFAHHFEAEQVKYNTMVQTETLSDSLYAATVSEILELAEQVGGLVHQWNGVDGGKNVSMLEIQRYGREYHASAYHLLATGGFVLRSQTIFERA
jgi:hypothetical protein